MPGTTTNFRLKWLSSTRDINGKFDSFISGRNTIKLCVWNQRRKNYLGFKLNFFDACHLFYLNGSCESANSRSMCCSEASMISSHIGGLAWNDPDSGLNSKNGLSTENHRTNKKRFSWRLNIARELESDGMRWNLPPWAKIRVRITKCWAILSKVTI